MDRPMVQLYMGLLAGSILYFTYSYMGVFIALISFVIYLIILWKARFKAYLTMVILGFTLLSFINCHIYFYSGMLGPMVEVRIEEERGIYYLGSHNGKNIKIFIEKAQGNNLEIHLGRKYLLKGEFKSKVDYPRGIKGEYYVESYVPLKEDFIYLGYKLKAELYRRLGETLKEEEAGVILALSCGDSSYIDYDKREEFNFLGISHIISISGLHVALIYSILKRITGERISLSLLLIFVIFTGGKPSTVRAFIMIVIMTMGVKVRRRYEPISALSFAAFILLLMRPFSPLDIGCVLSFLATLGILMFNGKISRKLYKLPSLINSSVALTISAMALTLPYMIFIFRKLSLGGFISNLLLIPFYTYLLIAGLGLLLFLKITVIFNFIMYITLSIFTIIEGMERFLLNNLPMPIEFTYLHGIIILFLYLSYSLIKRGVNSLKFFPIFLMILVLKENYIIYPEINFISGKKADVVQVLYEDKNILISTEKVKLRSIYEDYGAVDRIYDEFEEEIIIPLKDEYIIKVVQGGNNMEVYLTYKNRITKFITVENNTEKSESVQGVFSYENYAIIEVKKNEDVFNGRYYGNYKVVEGKTYSHYVH